MGIMSFFTKENGNGRQHPLQCKSLDLGEFVIQYEQKQGRYLSVVELQALLVILDRHIKEIISVDSIVYDRQSDGAIYNKIIFDRYKDVCDGVPIEDTGITSDLEIDYEAKELIISVLDTLGLLTYKDIVGRELDKVVFTEKERADIRSGLQPICLSAICNPSTRLYGVTKEGEVIELNSVGSGMMGDVMTDGSIEGDLEILRKDGGREYLEGVGRYTAELQVMLDEGLRVLTEHSLEIKANECKLLILDFDGVVADTETLYWECVMEYIEDTYGMLIDDDFVMSCVGKPGGVFKKFEEDFNITLDKNYYDYVYYRYFTKIQKILPYSYISGILDTNVHKVILTANRLPIVETQLRLWGLYDRFSKIISSTDEGKTKLEVIDELCDDLCIHKSDVLMFEDNPTMLETLDREGIPYVGIPNKFHPLDDIKVIFNES